MSRKTGALGGQFATPDVAVYINRRGWRRNSLPAEKCPTAAGKRSFHSQAGSPAVGGICLLPRVPWSHPIFRSSWQVDFEMPVEQRMWPDKCGVATNRRQIVGKGTIFWPHS